MKIQNSNVRARLWRTLKTGLVAALFIITQFFSGFSSPVIAADIYQYKNDYLKCSFKISGSIVRGDAEKFRKFIKSVYGKPEYYSLIFLNDSDLGPKADVYSVLDADREKRHRICLDSGGGSFVEALKFVDMFMPGFGTAVERGANCLSACAIIFMAGSLDSETGSGVLTDRYLHAGGNLGFHSPCLKVEDGVFDSKSVVRAYDIAIQTIAGVQSRLLKLKIGRSLIRAMLSTPASDMYLIKTTGQAAQWDIPIVGTVHPKEVKLFHAEQACNNFVNYFGQFFIPINEGRLEKLKPIFDDVNPLDMVNLRNNPDSEFELIETKYKGKLAGYGQEGGGFCNFEYEKYGSKFELLGIFDQGIVSRDLGYFVHGQLAMLPFHLFAPATQIKSITRKNDNEMERITIPSTNVIERYNSKQQCLVMSNTKILDNEPCDYSTITRLESSGTKNEISKYRWPSGAITVVQTKYSGRDQTSKINGAEAVRPKGISFPPSLGKSWEDYHCLKNLKTGNLLCSK